MYHRSMYVHCPRLYTHCGHSPVLVILHCGSSPSHTPFTHVKIPPLVRVYPASQAASAVTLSTRNMGILTKYPLLGATGTGHGTENNERCKNRTRSQIFAVMGCYTFTVICSE